ncbi:MAG: histidinol-phosphate transaminase [Flavobacteriaceae bacterium]|nr:histidinol-phosphate transaminase [Flavobacteriaceae bacterium]
MNIDKLIRDNVKALQPYSSARDEFITTGNQMVFLDANENPFETNVNRYPDPNQSNLKLRLATIKNIEPENILFGNGSDEVLDLIFRAFCEPKQDNIMILPPTYGMYKVLANINQVEVKSVNLNDSFHPNIEQILTSYNEQTKLLFLCSPNNPTGNSFSSVEVQNILMNFPGIVVIDEAYIDFSEQKSWLERLNEFPNLIITQTLSKAFGMAGIRLGICFASSPIINVLKKIKPPYNVNQLTQEAALTRLNSLEDIKAQIDSIKSEKTKLQEVLGTLNYIQKVYETDANFILIKVDNATRRYDQLIKRGIVVRNRSNQPLCENCLRITVGSEEENNLLIKTLKELES